MVDSVDQSDLMRELAHKNKMSTEEALTLCDALPGVAIDTVIGRWSGVGIATGHPLDGMLETFGWYGKEFIHLIVQPIRQEFVRCQSVK